MAKCLICDHDQMHEDSQVITVRAYYDLIAKRMRERTLEIERENLDFNQLWDMRTQIIRELIQYNDQGIDYNGKPYSKENTDE